MSGHKTDGREWGRAGKLDIIEKLDLSEVDETIAQMVSEYKSGQKDEDLEAEIKAEIEKGHNLAA